MMKTLVFCAALAVSGCGNFDRGAAAHVVTSAAPVACFLLPVIDPARGVMIGALCSDLAKLVADALAASAGQLKTISACDPGAPLVEIKARDGRSLGHVCAAYAAVAREQADKL